VLSELSETGFRGDERWTGVTAKKVMDQEARDDRRNFRGLYTLHLRGTLTSTTSHGDPLQYPFDIIYEPAILQTRLSKVEKVIFES